MIREVGLSSCFFFSSLPSLKNLILEMLKKRLGINAIESDWSLCRYFKIPSTLIISEEVCENR